MHFRKPNDGVFSTEATGVFLPWADTAGKFSTEADFLKFDMSGTQVYLRRRDGKAILVPIDRLIEANKLYLQCFEKDYASIASP